MPEEFPLAEGFKRFHCGRCDNYIDVKKELINLSKMQFPEGWICPLCNCKNWW